MAEMIPGMNWFKLQKCPLWLEPRAKRDGNIMTQEKGFWDSSGWMPAVRPSTAEFRKICIPRRTAAYKEGYRRGTIMWIACNLHSIVSLSGVLRKAQVWNEIGEKMEKVQLWWSVSWKESWLRGQCLRPLGELRVWDFNFGHHVRHRQNQWFS